METDIRNDASILREINSGEFKHFDCFINRYKTRLLNYIMHRIGDIHTAEDLTQEVFLRAFRAAHKGAFNGQLFLASTWLFVIARNCVTDFIRLKLGKPLLLESELGREASNANPIAEKESQLTDPTAEAIKLEDSLRITTVLAKLPGPQHEVLTLKVFGGLTLSEIAEVTGCPLGTVKSRMRYALMKIRELLLRNKEIQE